MYINDYQRYHAIDPLGSGSVVSAEVIYLQIAGKAFVISLIGLVSSARQRVNTR